MSFDSEGTAVKLGPTVIARDWQERQGTTGPSRAYVSACIKKGCPTDSLDNAWEWRKKNSKYGVIGYRSAGANLSRKAEETPVSTAVAHEASHTRVGDLSDLEASLRAAIDMETAAYVQAIGSKNEQTIRAYNCARDGRFVAEKAVREELERRKILVPMDEAKRLGRRGYEIMLPEMLSLGARIAGEVNPENPVLAASKIDHAMKNIIQRAQESYAA